MKKLRIDGIYRAWCLGEHVVVLSDYGNSRYLEQQLLDYLANKYRYILYNRSRSRRYSVFNCEVTSSLGGKRDSVGDVILRTCSRDEVKAYLRKIKFGNEIEELLNG